ncbi:MAG: hypothetical protein ABWX93_04590, partial [Pseudoxanthomonas sp.]
MYTLDTALTPDPTSDPLPDSYAAQPEPVPASAVSRKTLYVPLRLKFAVVLAFASSWMALSVWLSQSWLG